MVRPDTVCSVSSPSAAWCLHLKMLTGFAVEKESEVIVTLFKWLWFPCPAISLAGGDFYAVILYVILLLIIIQVNFAVL